MADLLRMKRRAGGASTSIDDLPKAEGTAELTTGTPAHKLDSDDAREEHRKLLSWFYYERDRQATNRLEMAMDHDFYDGDQWAHEDKAIVEARGQHALVYNEVAPMCDWIIGTERRNRADWKILPRAEDDVQLADVKTKVLKYVTDVNSAAFARSRAFADCVKGGEGWIDDGIRDDPSTDLIYSRYEDWRNVIMDSSGMDLSGDDARYVFRWRWVDEDIAMAMFPDRADILRSMVEDHAYFSDPDDEGLQWSQTSDDQPQRSGTGSAYSYGVSGVDAQRRRVKLIECQYRKPVSTKFVADGPHQGAVFDQRDKTLVQAVAQSGATIIDRITMRVHVAVFTERAMLAWGPSAYRHNKFSLTRLVCYRRNRDRMPYGVIRRVRSIQQDLNKRASKALWLMNTNQLLADRDAFDDWDEAYEEVQMPDGRIKAKPGSRIEIRRDTDAATGQLQLMAQASQAIQKSAGVTDENLGRRTNAVSGEAIKARQQQGAVVTTEPFDNQRQAMQKQGEKQLSLIEQYYSAEKVVRLTGQQGIEWVKINQPEVQADGSVRYINDVTASIADYVVGEADYAGTLRQVMFDSMNNIAQKMPPEMAVRFLRIAFEFSDLPNKREIVDEIRKLTGERDPQKQMTPEEAQQAQAQMAMQQEAMQMQRQQALAALQEQQAKAREVNARAEKLMAEAAAQKTAGGGDAAALQLQVERAVAQVREQAAKQIEALSAKLAQAQADTTTEIMRIKSEADTASEVARIQADATIRTAEVQSSSDKVLEQLTKRLDDIGKKIDDVASAEREPAEKEKESEPAQVQQPPVVIVQQGSAPSGVKFKYGADGKLEGAVLKREDGTEISVGVEGAKDSKQEKP